MPLYKEQELSHSSSTVFHDINSFPTEQQHNKQNKALPTAGSKAQAQTGPSAAMQTSCSVPTNPSKPQPKGSSLPLPIPSSVPFLEQRKLSENTVMYNTTASGGGGSKRTERKRDYIYSCLSLDVPAAINEEHLFWEELPSVQLLASEHYPNSCWKETHFHSLFSEVFQGNNKISTVAQQNSSSQAAGRNVKP